MKRWQNLEYKAKKMWLQILNSSLWVSSLALSIFSAGIDGEWMAKMQPWPWMGYALNFTGDMVSEVLMYHFGKLQKENAKNSKKWKSSWVILIFALVAVWYSWLFSWRQLLSVMVGAPPWVPFISAMFVPLLLLGIGYTQAIIESKLEKIDAQKQYNIDELIRKAVAIQVDEMRREFAEANISHRRADDLAAYEVMKRDGATCFYCDVDMTNWERDKIHIDHFVPVTEGGTDDTFNLVVSCQTCNLKKGPKLPTEHQVAKLQKHLIERSALPAKQKIFLLRHLGLVDSQKAIAELLQISASYVSSCLSEYQGQLDEGLGDFFNRLSKVGKLVPTLTEPENQVIEQGNNGHKAEMEQELQVKGGS